MIFCNATLGAHEANPIQMSLLSMLFQDVAGDILDQFVLCAILCFDVAGVFWLELASQVQRAHCRSH